MDISVQNTYRLLVKGVRVPDTVCTGDSADLAKVFLRRVFEGQSVCDFALLNRGSWQLRRETPKHQDIRARIIHVVLHFS
jgi:hypothetical protein